MNKKIYKVTQTQLSSLQSNGFITVDGVRYDYDLNSLYILADPFAPEYRLETQGHNLHLLKDNVIISDLTVPFAQASVYASNAKNLQNKTGSKAYTYYDILPRVDYKDFLLIKDLPMEGILCGFVRNGYFYKVREEDTNTDIPFTLFCQTIDGYYSLSTSEITTPIEGYTINDYFNEAKFIPYGSVKTVNNTEPDANGNVQLDILPLVDYSSGSVINDLPSRGILYGSKNGYFYKTPGVNNRVGLTFQSTDGYYYLFGLIKQTTMEQYFQQATFTQYGTVKKVNNTEPDADGNVTITIPLQIENIKDGTGANSIQQNQDGTGGKFDFSGKNPNAFSFDATLNGQLDYGAIGDFSSSFGGKGQARGKRSFQIGTNTIAYGNYTFASGSDSVAIGPASHVEGYNNTTGPNADSAHAEGGENIVTSNRGHVEGYKNTVKGMNGHGEGENVLVTENAEAGHAEGTNTKANNLSAHAEGQQTEANGINSHSENTLTKANGDSSHAEGYGNEVNSYAGHIEGSGNKILNTLPSSVGGDTPGPSPTDPDDPTFNINEHLGYNSHVEGSLNISYGYNSHTEGTKNTTYGHYAHTEGSGNKNYGTNNHMEGSQNNMSSTAAVAITDSHIEGTNNNVTNPCSNLHIGGVSNTGGADGAFIFGHNNEVSSTAKYSITLGKGLKSTDEDSIILGTYNKVQQATGRMLIIGNGTSNTDRKNAVEIMRDGRVKFSQAPKENDDAVRFSELNTKQDKLSYAQQSAIDSGITKESLDKINDDISQLKYNTFDVHQGLDTSGSELRQYTYFNKDVELNGGLKLNGGLTKLYSYSSMGFSIQPFFETKKEDINYFLGNYHTTGSRTDGYIFGWYKKPTSTGSPILDFSYIKVNADGTLSIDYAKNGNRTYYNFNNEINSIKNTYLSKNEAANYYVKKLGSTGEYKVYMSAPDGKDANRTIATAPIGSSVPIRTKEGHILLPDASVSMPAPNEAISAGVADDLYGLDRKTKDFHPTTTLRWLNNSDQREMVINGSWVGFYSSGHQLLILRGDTFTYLDKVVKWNDLADLVENGTVLLNGDTGSIGSYTSVGNGISSALNFAGQNISNTAKGVNSLSLGRLNSVEGAACFAYGNKNIIKGVASIAFGGGNTAGEKIDWTSLDAATNSSSSYCFAIGENNTSIGRTSITIGTANNSKGDGSISIGRDNIIWSKESVAIGRNNYLNRVSTGSYEENEPDQGNGIVAIGIGLKTPLRYRDVDYSNNFYWNCVISGRYNDPYAYNCVRSSDLVYASSLPPLFTLGNGLSDTNRNNAIVLFHNASAINSDFIYFNEYSIFNKKCEFRGSETIIEGILKDASGTQYIKGGTITASFINSLF